MKARPPDVDIVRRYRDERLSGKALAADLGLDPNVVYQVLRAAHATRPRGPIRRQIAQVITSRRPARPPRGPVLTDAERERRRRAADARTQALYRGVHLVPVRVSEPATSPKIPSHGYDHTYTRAVAQEFREAWWRTVSWSYDAHQSDARVRCDLCGVDTLGYIPTGGLVVCYGCWRLTATSAELRAWRRHLAEWARVRRKLRADHGSLRREWRVGPNPRRYGLDTSLAV